MLKLTNGVVLSLTEQATKRVAISNQMCSNNKKSDDNNEFQIKNSTGKELLSLARYTLVSLNKLPGLEYYHYMGYSQTSTSNKVADNYCLQFGDIIGNMVFLYVLFPDLKSDPDSKIFKEVEFGHLDENGDCIKITKCFSHCKRMLVFMETDYLLELPSKVSAAGNNNSKYCHSILYYHSCICN